MTDFQLRLIRADKILHARLVELDGLVVRLRRFYSERDNLQDDEDDARFAAATMLRTAILAVEDAFDALKGDV